MEEDRPHQPDLPITLRRRGHDEAQPAADGEKAADDHLTELVGFAPLAAVPGVEGGDRDEHREAHPRVDRDHPACRDRRAEEGERSEEHTSELQSLMRISYAVFCLKK